jgi:hypothetical protein
MPWPRAAAVLLSATLLALLVTLAIGHRVLTQAEETEGSPPGGFGVEWDYEPADLPDLVANTPAVVVAHVEAVHDGDPMVVGPVDPDTGIAPSVPTQRVDLHVTQSIDGETPADFTLFVLGGPGERPEGAPRFDLGETDLLFVRPRLNDAGTAANPDGTWIAVAPEGRLEKLPSGELDSPTDGPVADVLDGATVPEASDAIDAAQAAGGGQSTTTTTP